MDTVKTFEFATSQVAWEGINEYFLLEGKEIKSRMGTVTPSLIIAYDTIIKIRKLWVDPEFNFSKVFNYRIQKWRTLVSNYVNMNMLDLVKIEVQNRERKKDTNYNISFLFDNTHQSGKGCLVSLTFSRRNYMDTPILIATLRSSEIVKRLNFDFLLVQRIGEYVYGKDVHLAGELFIPNMYTVPEVTSMYHMHKDIHKILKGVEKLSPFQQRTIDTVEKFSTIKVESIGYKIHQRAAKVLQGYGKDKPLYAKHLTL